jgi:hypothetical protein
MKTRTLYTALIIFIFITGAVQAQNSPAGGLASGNVLNRDVDTYMMVNFAPYLNYDKFFAFVQTSMYSSVLQSAGLPGFQAGLATKVGTGFMNFYLNTSGYSLDDKVEKKDDAASVLEDSSSKGNLNLQFDTIYGHTDFGAFKLGLNFAGVGTEETFKETNSTDFAKTIKNKGTITPSIEYGRNWIHDDYSMQLVGGKVAVRFPNGDSKSITETTTGGTTTTVTSIDAQNPYSASYPNLDLNNIRLDASPQLWWFFPAQLEPMIVISHIYLINTFTMMFFPEELETTERAGFSNGYKRQERNYLANNLFGYYNRQYVITSKLSLAWRINFQAAFYYDKKGHTYDRAPGGAEIETKETKELLWIGVNIVPRLAFGYQVIPGTLTLNGAVVMNQLGGSTAFGWQLNRTITTNEDGVVTNDSHSFNGINPVFNLGAALNISPFLIIEAGASIKTSGPGSPLSDVSVGVVYKR